MDSNMEIENPCLKCIGSCCSLIVEISKSDYLKIVELGHKKEMTKQSSIFMEENPEYKNRQLFLDSMYDENFAIINKGENGFCVFLDKETRLCRIYDQRPETCSEFSNQSKTCKTIRKCIN